MVASNKYSFSFTGTALRVNELDMVLKSKVLDKPVNITQDLGSGKASSGGRVLSDLNKRANQLNDGLTKLYINSDYHTKKLIAYLSICKAYSFISEFVIEVLREKVLVYDYTVTDGDFITFYRRKQEMHPEMETLTDNTQYKIKQISFKVLEQAGIIDSVSFKQIQPQILDNKLIQAIVKDDPNWLKLFFVSDLDIENYM